MGILRGFITGNRIDDLIFMISGVTFIMEEWNRSRYRAMKSSDPSIAGQCRRNALVYMNIMIVCMSLYALMHMVRACTDDMDMIYRAMEGLLSVFWICAAYLWVRNRNQFRKEG